jgi:hypothetical protein
MDPLSITVAVVGLATAAFQVSHILRKAIKNNKEAPEYAELAFNEVKEFSVVIVAIKALLSNLDAVNRNRAYLIELEPIIATLTDAVLTFSEFQRILDSLVDITGLAGNIRWARSQSNLERLTKKVQHHRGALSLMLNIIQWYVLSMLICLFFFSYRTTTVNRTWRLNDPHCHFKIKLINCYEPMKACNEGCVTLKSQHHQLASEPSGRCNHKKAMKATVAARFNRTRSKDSIASMIFQLLSEASPLNVN